MSGQAASSRSGTPESPGGLHATTRELTGYWWLALVSGIAWIVIALVILQFDSSSIATVGVLIGLMFALASAQNLTLASVTEGGTRFAAALFAVVFLVSAVICFVNPEGTFAAMADILGFLFFLVGVWWMFQAFLERAINPFWWLRLISGILMTIMAFWTSGQFFIERAYVLLVFAGIWAMMEGINSIVRAFAIRRLHEDI
ncbi:MAG: HdeD family acid-resistance protein [Candidatus Limnocylindria bacterium]